MVAQSDPPRQSVDKRHPIRKWFERCYRGSKFVANQRTVFQCAGFSRAFDALGLDLVGIHAIALHEKEDSAGRVPEGPAAPSS